MSTNDDLSVNGQAKKKKSLILNAFVEMCRSKPILGVKPSWQRLKSYRLQAVIINHQDYGNIQMITRQNSMSLSTGLSLQNCWSLPNSMASSLQTYSVLYECPT